MTTTRTTERLVDTRLVGEPDKFDGNEEHWGLMGHLGAVRSPYPPALEAYGKQE